MIAMLIKDLSEQVWRITQEVIPSANQKRSLHFLKAFRDLYYPTIGKIEIMNRVTTDPQEYLKFCETLILRKNKLPDNEFSMLIKQINKLNLEQMEMLLNAILLAKAELLYLINKKEDGLRSTVSVPERSQDKKLFINH